MKRLSFLAAAIVTLGASFMYAQPALATPVSSVCAAFCDYTTLADAISNVTTTGKTITVGSDYDPAADTASFPITVPAGTTINCQDSGAIIGQVTPLANNQLYLSGNATIRNCSLGNIVLKSVTSSPNIQILNNIFSTVTTSTIFFDQGPVDTFLIEGNTNINALFIADGMTSDGGIIRNNTFYFHDLNPGERPFELKAQGGNSNTLIASNTFESYLMNDASNILIHIAGTDMSFVTNTVKYLNAPYSNMAGSVEMMSAGTGVFSGNIVDAPPTASCEAARLRVISGDTILWQVLHNTLRVPAACANGIGVTLTDEGNAASNAGGEFSYNLITRDGALSDDNGLRLEKEAPASTLHLDTAYNAIYRFSIPLKDKNQNTGMSFGADTYYTNPYFRTGNITTSDDDELAPFSPYLDVNGSLDIGAIAGTRDPIIDIDEHGVIDYTSVDATSTVGIGDVILSGDTVNLSAGTYAPISVSSTRATSTITITGIGRSAYIDGSLSPEVDGIFLSNVTSSEISNVTIYDASSTAPGTYRLDLINGVYGGEVYDHAVGMIGAPASSTLYIASEMPGSYTANGFDFTTAVQAFPADWNLVLLNLGGDLTTMLISNLMAASAADVTAGLGVTPVAFATSTFIYNSGDGTYAFNQTALDDAGITLSPWNLASPQLAKTPGRRLSGIRLDNASHIGIYNVTTTRNGNGISFGVGTDNVTVTDGIFYSNTNYDLNHESDSRVVLDNSGFERTSSTFSGAGDALVKFNTRIVALDRGTYASVAAADVTATDASEAVTSLGTTDMWGQTAYQSLNAYVLSGSSLAVTNGGYNDYTFHIATSTYIATSTTETLTTRKRTLYVYMLAGSGPLAPTSAVASSITTSTVTLGWTDNSGDEDSFSVEYIRSLRGDAYPGTVTNVLTDVSSLDVLGLIPGEQYAFRVAAVNTAATSTYVTSSVFTMAPVTPAAPTLATVSRTAISAAVASDANSDLVDYALYSSTLGGYVNGSGAVSATPVWQSSADWGTLAIGSLTCNTAYAVVAIAHNLASVESATSSASTVTTSACEVVSSGGGGGGATSYYPPAAPIVPTPAATSVIITVADPVIASSSTEVIPPVVTSSTELKASDLTLKMLDEDAKQFKVTLSAADRERLAIFIQFGTSNRSKALGSGERRAVIRDIFETIGRAISSSDIEKLVGGEIPSARNIVKERAAQPRALATFQNIYGHKPDFKNAEENLAWNTLMYRIRFPRDLRAEKQGIQAFRKLFNKDPKDPFQWAVVRVLGYVKK